MKSVFRRAITKDVTLPSASTHDPEMKTDRNHHLKADTDERLLQVVMGHVPSFLFLFLRARIFS